jgi:rubredoxin
MPIYEFECKMCGEEFDYLFMLSSKTSAPGTRTYEMAECPDCGELHDKDERIEMSVGHFKIDMRNVSPL